MTELLSLRMKELGSEEDIRRLHCTNFGRS